MNIQAIRQDFPILNRQINGKPLIYFDNAATSQKPYSVIDAITNYYQYHNGNIHRAIHTLSSEATELFEKSREKISKFINAKSPNEIIFTRGTTEAINLVAYSLGCDTLGSDDEVLISLMEHHSNIVPWEIIAKCRGFTVKYGHVNKDGTLDYQDFMSKITKKTKICCLSHVSNVTGVINDVKCIAKVAHDNGALMLIDGAQSVPHMKVDVQDLNVDFLAFSGHKMLGPTGVGVLYGKKEALQKMTPFQGGGEMIKDVSFSADHCVVSWNELPWKFEAGTPDIAGVIGLGAAIDYLVALGMDNVFNHEKDLTQYATECLKKCRDITLYGPTDLSQKCGILPFCLRGFSSHETAALFNEYGIALRSGYHCAQPLHQILNLPSSARASFYIYNTKAEIDRFIEIIEELNS
ncbi:MAG: cysteine desulfurase [Nitrososphaerota archaeon]|nr:cysteine desulfurase [Nitrososphaerota archaeon]